jgi:hypothetical protein
MFGLSMTATNPCTLSASKRSEPCGVIEGVPDPVQAAYYSPVVEFFRHSILTSPVSAPHVILPGFFTP